jgi:uncharacterized repeat protein (TIGR03803 family)
MRSKKPFSAGKPTSAIFIMLLLASAIVPTQAQAQKFEVLHTFHGRDGAYPTGGLIRDSAGNFYGITDEGGTSKGCPHGCGTVFELSNSGKEIVLYSFTGKNGDGKYPASEGSPVRDAAGNIYGTTFAGGDLTKCGDGCGVVFKVNKEGKETILHIFGKGTDGYEPFSGLFLDAKGRLYGTTEGGGANNGGTIFKIAKGGAYSILHSFDFPGMGTDGADPVGPLILDSLGNLYGTTIAGGQNDCGTIFKLDTGGSETVFYSFPCGSGGDGPIGKLLVDGSGNLYGTTKVGGNSGCFNGGGCGVVFKVDSSATETVLYTFSGGTDGRYPFAGLVMDSSGNLYGTTINGGKAGVGVAFKVDTGDNETVLHDFTGGSDGGFPGDLLRGPAGNLYGVAAGGGSPNCQGGCGTVFRITPSSQ